MIIEEHPFDPKTPWVRVFTVLGAADLRDAIAAVPNLRHERKINGQLWSLARIRARPMTMIDSFLVSCEYVRGPAPEIVSSNLKTRADFIDERGYHPNGDAR